MAAARQGLPVRLEVEKALPQAAPANIEKSLSQAAAAQEKRE
jgi:hypothetical protein